MSLVAGISLELDGFLKEYAIVNRVEGHPTRRERLVSCQVDVVDAPGSQPRESHGPNEAQRRDARYPIVGWEGKYFHHY